MVGLTYMENGFRNVFSTKPITKPADLKGVKIRIMENQIQTATFSALNAIVTNMASARFIPACSREPLMPPRMPSAPTTAAPTMRCARN